MEDSVTSTEVLETIGADLRLSERSEGSDQDIVILGIRCFDGHIDDVNWIFLCVLRGTQIGSLLTGEKQMGQSAFEQSQRSP